MSPKHAMAAVRSRSSFIHPTVADAAHAVEMLEQMSALRSSGVDAALPSVDGPETEPYARVWVPAPCTLIFMTGPFRESKYAHCS